MSHHSCTQASIVHVGVCEIHLSPERTSPRLQTRQFPTECTKRKGIPVIESLSCFDTNRHELENAGEEGKKKSPANSMFLCYWLGRENDRRRFSFLPQLCWWNKHYGNGRVSGPFSAAVKINQSFLFFISNSISENCCSIQPAKPVKYKYTLKAKMKGKRICLWANVLSQGDYRGLN